MERLRWRRLGRGRLRRQRRQQLLIATGGAGWQAANPPLVLASGSSARRSLMQAAGLSFVAKPAELDETAIKAAIRARGGNASAAAMALAAAKAAAIEATGCLVLGCDQILQCDDQWFDKPTDLAAARKQLTTLRGREHRLETATCCFLDGRQVWKHLASPSLTMRDFSDDFLERYLAMEGDHVLSTVGAYRLEGIGITLFASVSGDHSAILGLPMLPLLHFLRSQGALAT